MDFMESMITAILIIFLMFVTLIKIETENKKEIEIIKREKEVYIYKECNKINNEYYCWEEIKEEEKNDKSN